MSIPRCYLWSSEQEIEVCGLFGFYNAASQAYSIVVYISVGTSAGKSVKFVNFKTIFSPTKGVEVRIVICTAFSQAYL